MTPNEIQMLIVGISLGAQLVAGLHAFWNWRDARRDAANARRRWRIINADRFHNSLRIYQIQQRSRV
ncbi:hypothetical protein [Streptomyces griseorubiginosus]|uniref:hypothetical protein n=1 Tax=Streptomyces griseorubiginosus TaxID=67304 RepID=UPI002E8244B6|nr:hypothetical protein [Streptomyces griseorubiginosus]WUB45303.1 hypothetical protein OHN19_18910 [Streptomyces griseorubiginosus]WUB53820.1 hypothetical protein OG942_18905 [Streptomyces griseorubiginosus]